MRRRRHRTLAARAVISTATALFMVCAAGSADMWAATARADETSPADIAAARQLGVEGVKLANAGNCNDAIDRLSRAEKLYHAPTVLGRLGECQVAVGKIVEGTESLQRVVREPLARNAPSAFVKAHARAKRVLDANRSKIAHLHILMSTPHGVEVTLTLDGDPLSTALVGADRPTNPGDHVIEASAPGYLKARETVSLREGGDVTVTLTLNPDADAKTAAPPSVVTNPAPSAPPSPPSPPSSSQLSPRGPSRLPSAIAFGLGTVGLGVGGVFGALALGKRGTLDQNCNTTKVCPSTEQSDLDSAKTLATVSTIGFIAGGVGVAAGVVLLFVPSAPKTEEKAYWQPYLTPSGAGVVGRF